ncbi:Alpha,alpha-trehalose-phosphate synthase [UDP-forming] [Cucumispora dikerogammari]|nr:Alpha,alpha-trehalose-phosphate synthase [UDP-forming] [Cucumispora dikerogammari]
MSQSTGKKNKLIIISNRLPISITKDEQTGEFIYTKNSGGLVTGLLCLQNRMNFLWMGNIPSNYTSNEKEEIKKTLKEKYKSHPVFIKEILNEKSYNGYCNQILWPILHNYENCIQNTENYIAYKEYNLAFFRELKKVVDEGDTVWVHDYHMMLLPYFIRRYLKKYVKIGFFLHTVFPIKEFFQLIENHNELLSGILCADSIAFHTLDYVCNFTSNIRSLKHVEGEFTNTLLRNLKKHRTKRPVTLNIHRGAALVDILKMKISNISISIFNKRDIKLSAIPIGIDPSIFIKELQRKETQDRIIELKNGPFKDKFIFLGVDRMDFIKGIPQRIRAFKKLLEENPHLIEKVVFVQVGVPSRETIDEYTKYTKLVKLEAQSINSKFGNIDTNLVYFLNESISFSELVALYNISNACVVTSLCDGMNLIALEYIASQTLTSQKTTETKQIKTTKAISDTTYSETADFKNTETLNDGVLILSELAGSASLLTGSLFCNPNSISDIKNAMMQSILISKKERNERLVLNSDAVIEFTSFKWANDNLDALIS